MTDLTYRSPRTEVRDSAIHGRGLFARTDIARGEIVAVKGGHVLTQQQWKALEPTLGSAEIQLTEDLFIAPVDQAERHGSMPPWPDEGEASVVPGPWTPTVP